MGMDRTCPIRVERIHKSDRLRCTVVVDAVGVLTVVVDDDDDDVDNVDNVDDVVVGVVNVVVVGCCCSSSSSFCCYSVVVSTLAFLPDYISTTSVRVDSLS